MPYHKRSWVSEKEGYKHYDFSKEKPHVPPSAEQHKANKERGEKHLAQERDRSMKLKAIKAAMRAKGLIK